MISFPLHRVQTLLCRETERWQGKSEENSSSLPSGAMLVSSRDANVSVLPLFRLGKKGKKMQLVSRSLSNFQ